MQGIFLYIAYDQMCDHWVCYDWKWRICIPGNLYVQNDVWRLFLSLIWEKLRFKTMLCLCPTYLVFNGYYVHPLSLTLAILGIALKEQYKDHSLVLNASLNYFTCWFLRRWFVGEGFKESWWNACDFKICLGAYVVSVT